MSHLCSLCILSLDQGLLTLDSVASRGCLAKSGDILGHILGRKELLASPR